MNTLSKLKQLGLDEDTRLLRDYNIVDDLGDLTDEGNEVLMALLLEANKEALVKKLRALKDSDDQESGSKKD